MGPSGKFPGKSLELVEGGKKGYFTDEQFTFLIRVFAPQEANDNERHNDNNNGGGRRNNQVEIGHEDLECVVRGTECNDTGGHGSWNKRQDNRIDSMWEVNRAPS